MLDIAKLNYAHKIAAKVVAKFGDAYLPIFNRMHEELKAVESNDDLKSLAIKISQTENSL